ncbi:MAG: FkbM family methyltransferase [Acidobacteria bacterium]|nr:FkbM family methyltransferase [Acidobacteriota bacterium]
MFGYATSYARMFGMLGLIGAVTAKVRRHPVTCTIKRPFPPHPLSVRIPSTDVLLYRQIFERHEYAVPVSRPPRVIVDAGANVGLAAVYFAHRFPDARIIAIEPEAHNFALLAANVADYPNVVPVKAALWHTNTVLDLFDPGLGSWGYVVGHRDECPGTWRQLTDAVTVDKVMRTHGLDRIDLLKMDIEGSEREVLADPAAWIECVDAMVVELHERKKAGCAQVFEAAAQQFDARWHGGELEYLLRSGAAVTGPAQGSRETNGAG